MTIPGLGGQQPAPWNAPPGGQVATGIQPGVTGAVITAQLVIVSGPSAGVFVYSGTPGLGNPPIVSITAGTSDPFGNPVTPGLEVTQGMISGPIPITIGETGGSEINLIPNTNQAFDITSAITGVLQAVAQFITTDVNEMMPSVLGSVLLGTGTATKMSTVLHSPFGTEGAALALEAQNDAGTDTAVVTLGTVSLPDGMTMVFTPILTLIPYAMVVYSGSSGQVVKTYTGSTTWTAPAGVTQVKAECWGGGAGGQWNSGPGGGGGEYACEPANTVVPGNVYTVTVGSGGGAGSSGSGPGGPGVNSVFSGTGATTVTAHGAGRNNTSPSPAGTGSTNTIHFNGGSCTDSGGSGIGGGGGGGSGGTSSAGGNGGAHSGTTHGAGAPAAPGGGGGGNGGNVSSAGSNGSTPGGGAGSGGSGGSGFNGGNGAAGQVRITYTTGAPTVGFSLNCGAAFTDQFGNTIPASALQFAANGTLWDIVRSQISTLTVTNANAGTAPITASWPIPAGDMQVGSQYEVEVPFAGEFEPGGTGSPQLALTGYLDGASHASSGIGSGFFPAATAFNGAVKVRLMCTATGTDGTVIMWLDGGLGNAATRSSGTNNDAAYLSTGPTGALTVDTTAAHTLAVAAAWGSSVTGQTITGTTSTLTRTGP